MVRAVAMRKRFEPIGPGVQPKADEWHYYATSAPPHLLSPSKLLETIREHWRIENTLHWRKDVTLGEDAHVLRKGQAPMVMSALRTMALGLMDRMEIPGLPAQTAPQKMAYLAGNVDRVLDAINGKGII